MPTTARRPEWGFELSDESLFGLHEAVLDGLPADVVDRLGGFTAAEVARYAGISPATLARRRKAGRLSTEESERFARLARMLEQATELFEGDAAGAADWLRRPARALGRKVPAELARTEYGARLVEQLIGRLEHGVFT